MNYFQAKHLPARMRAACKMPGGIVQSYRSLFLTILLVVSGLTFAGCIVNGGDIAPPVGVNTNPDNATSNAGYANRELNNARRMIRAGDYSQVIPRLTNVVSTYPDSPSAIEARYYLGVTYKEIGGVRNAMDFFNEYLEMAPDGPYAEHSRQYLTMLSDEARRDPRNPAHLESRVDELQRRLDETPEDLAAQLELADTYWRQERYNEAGLLYSRIIRELPQMQADQTIRQRLDRADDGTFIILTPDEVLRRETESQPILVFNTSSFKSGRFEGWPAVSRYRYYNVTGQIVNRSNETFSNVQAIVTIYGFGNQIYDTTTVNVGRMHSGETRPFSVRFSNFDDIQNVSKYETDVSYQQ